MKLENLQDLYVEELRDLYSAENQIIEAMPKMIEAASHQQLKDAFTTHLQETQGQVQRLEQIFEKLGQEPGGVTCNGMKGVLKEGAEMVKQRADEAVRDAGLISAAQRIEHYEIAGYGTARTYANLLGHSEDAQLLQATLDEEGETDHKLTRLAESSINLEAAEA